MDVLWVIDVDFIKMLMFREKLKFVHNKAKLMFFGGYIITIGPLSEEVRLGYDLGPIR